MQKGPQEGALEEVRNHPVLLMVGFSRDSIRESLVMLSSISQRRKKETHKAVLQWWETNSHMDTTF